MHPVLLQIGDFTLHSYGAAMVVGFAVCLVLLLRNRPPWFDIVDFFNVGLIVAAGCLVGGRLDVDLESVDQCWTVLGRALRFWEPHALSFVPGSALAVGLATVYCRLRGLPISRFLDLVVPYGLIVVAIQRTLGCFMAGCCYGTPTDWMVGLKFSAGSSAWAAFGGLPLHPTQLYYAVAALATYWLLRGLGSRVPRSGVIAGLGIAALMVSYAGIGFWRADWVPVSATLPVTASQLVAGIIALIGLAFALIRLRGDTVRTP